MGNFISPTDNLVCRGHRQFALLLINSFIELRKNPENEISIDDLTWFHKVTGIQLFIEGFDIF